MADPCCCRRGADLFSSKMETKRAVNQRSFFFLKTTSFCKLCNLTFFNRFLLFRRDNLFDAAAIDLLGVFQIFFLEVFPHLNSILFFFKVANHVPKTVLHYSKHYL